MKKLLFYINSLSKGGAERVMANLANSFAQDGYDVVLVTSLSKQQYELDKLVKHRILDDKNRNVVFKNIVRIKRLSQVCKEEKPDLIISFTIEASVRAVIVAKLRKIPKIVSVRNAPPIIFKGMRGKIAKRLYRYADGIVCQNLSAKQYFSDELQKKIAVIPNMLNPDFLLEPYVGERRKRVVNAGRLEAQKNQALLINAFSIFHKKHPDWTLCIYGEGSLRDKLTEQIDGLGLKEYVEMPGVINNVANAIHQDGMFVLSSDFEGLPNALLEAMVEGLPAISTDCIGDGARDVIDSGKNGLLVSRGDAEGLAEAMDKIASDNEFARGLSSEAVKLRDKLSPDKVYSMWKQYIEEFI